MTSIPWKKNFVGNISIVFRFLLYAVVSILSFLLTTNGWSALFYIVYGIPFYIGVFLLLFILSFLRPFSIDRKHVWFTVGIQLFILLFNFGDCGGSAGGEANFIQRVLKGGTARESCADLGITSPLIPGEIVLIFIALYILSMFYTIFRMTSKRSS